ncbi:MAG: helix-turn-helix domain-containing protein [Pseudobdellovibrionaceae bacterium]
MTTHKLFCINLSKIRRDRGLTQQEMADKLGMTIRNYQAYEYAYKTTGTPWPRPERIDEFARTLKCKPSDFFKEP